jgi:precorrin-3B C17-methyltransferase
VIGYSLYLEQASPWIREGAAAVSSVMTEETKRAEEALELAQKGGRVSVVSGGDPGIYAMAGVIFEVAAGKKIPLGTGPGKLNIRIIPGTPALVAAASLLGAPITHDFCAISLSDRLTDWELIKRRLDLASQCGLIIAIYNPKSHGRSWQLGEAKEILLKNISGDTPVGLASRLGRHGEKSWVVKLKDLNVDEVDMQTILIVGNETTFVYDGHLITPRGYVNKYGPDGKGGAKKAADKAAADKASDKAPAGGKAATGKAAGGKSPAGKKGDPQ